MTVMDNTDTQLKDTTMIEINKSTIDKYKRGSNSDKLFVSERIIFGLKNTSAVQNIMKQVGYHQDKIDSFSAIYESALELYIKHQKKQSDKLVSHSEFIKLFDAVINDFRFMLKVAKLALKNHSSKAEKLQLNTKKGRSIADYFTHMDVFYSQTLNDNKILDLFNAFGYHQERISGLYRDYKLSFDAYLNYGTNNSEAIESTRIKDLKIKELDIWVLEYFTLVKVAIGTI